MPVWAMPMHNLIEYSTNYSKIGSLWQYCREPDDSIADSTLYKFNSKFTNNTGYGGVVDLEIAVSLKYLGKFWRTFEIPLINCENNFILIWPSNCVICKVAREATYTKGFVPVVKLSTQDNTKLL